VTRPEPAARPRVRGRREPAALREQEREVLLLFAWGELSYAEIAVVTGDPIGTVRSRLSRARSHLRAVLDASATFGGYERIPLAGAGADLLEIDAAPGTRVIERTIEQIKNP
jgi:DNA-binding CsgD family transcriptional regulator